MEIEINIFTGPQFGVMLEWGRNFEGRRFFNIGLPFLSIQFNF